MAVSREDRISSFRLKQFYDKLKLELAQMFKDAKPNYNEANTNDQIGKGFGYNEIFKQYKFNPVNSAISPVSASKNIFGVTDATRPFVGNPIIYKQIEYMQAVIYPNTDIGITDFGTDLLKFFAGSMSGISETMATDPNFVLDDILADDNSFNSHFIPSENCLESPKFTVGEHTYQTKINIQKSGSQILYFIATSVDGGEYSEYIGMGDYAGFIWISGYNHLLFNVGSCAIIPGTIESSDIKDGTIVTSDMTTNIKNFLTVYHDETEYYSGAGRLNQWRQNNISAAITVYGPYDDFNTDGRISIDTVDTNRLKITGSSSFRVQYVGSRNNNPNRYGKLALKTDTGYYECYCKIEQSIGTWTTLYLTPLDTTFLSHLSETNAFIIFQYNDAFSVQVY